MEWYLKVLKENYADFNGRARRTEFWMFALINFVVAIVLGSIGYIIGTSILSTIYSLAVIVPGIAVSVRRLHDIGKSGWWWLIVFVPIIGGIVLIVFAVMDSQPGDNEYGANPKGVATTN
jgi:uncharacterized membrane protein YhaH (DUF805 family)